MVSLRRLPTKGGAGRPRRFGLTGNPAGRHTNEMTGMNSTAPSQAERTKKIFPRRRPVCALPNIAAGPALGSWARGMAFVQDFPSLMLLRHLPRWACVLAPTSLARTGACPRC